MKARRPLSEYTRPNPHKGGRALTRAEKESRTEMTGGFSRIEHELVPDADDTTDKKSTY